MTSPIDDELDAIAARALHDPEMREILSDLGVNDSDGTALRAKLGDIPATKLDELLARSEDLEQQSGRSNEVYRTLGDFAKDRWIELIREQNERAVRLMENMKPAMDAIRLGNPEAYENHRTRFAEQGETMKDGVAAARNELRRDIRREIAAGNFSLDTETRAPLVDHLTRAAPVPQAISEVMSASSRLEAAKAKQDMELMQQRHLGHAASPRASLDI